MHVDADGESRLSRLAALYRTHGDLVRWVVRTRGIPSASVEDVVHDVFLALHRRWGERSPGVPVRGWIISVARNVAFSERRSLARRERRIREAQEDFEACCLDRQVDARRALGVLQRFVDELPPAQAEVFVLSEVHGVPAPEIASGLGSSVNTVYSRLRLARARFVAKFGELPARDYATLLQEIERVAKAPPAEVDRRWALLVPQLSAPAASVTFPFLGGWAGVVAGMAIVGSIVGMVRAAISTPSPDGAERAGARQHDPPSSPAPSASRSAEETRKLASGARAETAGAAVSGGDSGASMLHGREVDGRRATATLVGGAGGTSEEPSDVGKPQGTARDAVRTAERRGGGGSSRPDGPARSVASATAVDTNVGAEARLLRYAKTRLDAGRIDDARRALQEHARVFPEGSLRRERLRLNVDVWCQVGRRDRAADAAAELDALSPQTFPGRTRNQPCGE